MPIKPEPAVAGSNYAVDLDEAERSSSGIGQSKIEVTSRASRSASIDERLSRGSTTGKFLSWRNFIETYSSTTKCHPVRDSLHQALSTLSHQLFLLWQSYGVTGYPSGRPIDKSCGPLSRIPVRIERSNSPSEDQADLNIVEDHPAGYPQLAAFIASDDNFCMYRKFDRASSRVLLHLQSEIAALDNGLNQMDRTDDGSVTAYRLRSIRHKEGWDDEQRKLITKLQERLPIYCEPPPYLTSANAWANSGTSR
jgi:hypothetical protein